MKESDLYLPLRQFLEGQGFCVRSEVHHCDVVALKGEEMLIVEMKKGLTLDLLTQGVKRQRLTDAVYLAIPKPKNLRMNARWKDLLHLLRRLELGLLFVNSAWQVEVALPCEPFSREKSKAQNKKKRVSLLVEARQRTGEQNTGGVSKQKILTSYREKALFIAFCLREKGELSPKALKDLGACKQKTGAILGKNHYNWFYRVSRGVYGLTEQGKQALGEYSPLVSSFTLEV